MERGGAWGGAREGGKGGKGRGWVQAGRADPRYDRSEKGVGERKVPAAEKRRLGVRVLGMVGGTKAEGALGEGGPSPDPGEGGGRVRSGGPEILPSLWGASRR